MSFDWRAAVPWVLLPFAGSIPGSFLTKKNIPGWYEVNNISDISLNWFFKYIAVLTHTANMDMDIFEIIALAS